MRKNRIASRWRALISRYCCMRGVDSAVGTAATSFWWNEERLPSETGPQFGHRLLRLLPALERAAPHLEPAAFLDHDRRHVDAPDAGDFLVGLFPGLHRGDLYRPALRRRGRRRLHHRGFLARHGETPLPLELELVLELHIVTDGGEASLRPAAGSVAITHIEGRARTPEGGRGSQRTLRIVTEEAVDLSHGARRVAGGVVELG